MIFGYLFCHFVLKMRTMDASTCSKLVEHDDKGSSTSKFYKHKSKDDHYRALSNDYSIALSEWNKIMIWI